MSGPRPEVAARSRARQDGGSPAYDGTHARVSIWQTGVGGYQDSSLPPQEAWGMTTVQLKWIDKDWRETARPWRTGQSRSPTAAPDPGPEPHP